MSSTINASTASGGGIVTSADASGILALQTAGVTGLSIDASQKVTFANSLTSPTLVTPTIDSASVPTVSGTAPLYMCRAWVNFNGTGTVAIRASGNVSSITDNGVGDYTVNFTTAMPDANYSVTSCADSLTGNAISVRTFDGTTARTTALFRVQILNSIATTVDSGICQFAVLR
jgi:hypothetical protein